MRKLDTHSLELFVAVALCLNYRQAAEQLHMTQPPLSRAIKQLEQRLGVQLFVRDTQHVALTDAARQLLPLAQQILAQLDAAEQALAARAAPSRLRIGLTTAVDADLFRAWCKALADALAPATLEWRVDSSPKLVAALRARRLDAAIIAQPTDSHGLPAQALGRQALMAALPASHPLARRRVLKLSDLQAEKIYWFERARQPAYFDHCHAVFRRHGFAPAFMREPHDQHVLLSEVAAGKGIALLPASFGALRRAGVVYRKLAEGDELAVGLGLLVDAGHPASATLRRLAAELLD